ncbi:MAG: methyltransferase domain-containing protein [Sphingobium sp.]|nr:methyltransferase domain-containing protein [Sphingobium sp.]
MEQYQDESIDFWRQHDADDLAVRVAALHQQRRQAANQHIEEQVALARKTVADLFVKGEGIEVGAGTRPFPIPDSAVCRYGDARDKDALKIYFKVEEVADVGFIDAQTFAGVSEESQDFVISAHVIEHLFDAAGSIGNAIRVLRPGGVYIMAVPDMRFTFDHLRQPTPIPHFLKDMEDGGESTRLEAYEDFLRHVAIPVFDDPLPESQIFEEAKRLCEAKHDIHVHAWTTHSLNEMLEAIRPFFPFDVIGQTLVMNENIVVLKKR